MEFVSVLGSFDPFVSRSDVGCEVPVAGIGRWAQGAFERFLTRVGVHVFTKVASAGQKVSSMLVAYSGGRSLNSILSVDLSQSSFGISCF